jgi:hypothetical protein
MRFGLRLLNGFQMLPEFPAAQDAIQKAWNEVFFKALGFSDPLIAELEFRVQKEGTRAFIGDSEMEYRKASVQHQWRPEAGKGLPFDEFFTLADKLGREMARQQAEHCFQVLSTPGPHNAVLERTDKQVSFDDFVLKMEGIELDFDKAGMPKWPMWFVAPDVYVSLQQNPEASRLTEERKQRLADLVLRKRKEFDEREARRRLVD